LNIFIPTATLEAWKVEYSIIRQREGQVVITSPNTYHQAFNATNSITEAVNYARNWKRVDYAYCSPACAQFQQDDKPWAPLIVYSLMGETENVGRLQGETVPESLLADIRHRLASAIMTRSKRDSTKNRRQKSGTQLSDSEDGENYVGGINAIKYTTLMLEIGSEEILDKLTKAVVSPAMQLQRRLPVAAGEGDGEGEGEDAENDEWLDALQMYRYGGVETTRGDLDVRSAALCLHYKIDSTYAKSRAIRSLQDASKKDIDSKTR